jgi:hypothetical protein
MAVRGLGGDACFLETRLQDRRQGEAKMDHLMTTTGQLAGCMVFAMLIVRGLVALVYDFTKWTLEKNGVKEDQ